MLDTLSNPRWKPFKTLSNWKYRFCQGVPEKWFKYIISKQCCQSGAGREMAGPPTSPFGRAPPSSPFLPPPAPSMLHQCTSRFAHPSITQLIALFHCYFFFVFHSITSNMVPTHLHASGVAWPFFNKHYSSAQTSTSRTCNLALVFYWIFFLFNQNQCTSFLIWGGI